MLTPIRPHPNAVTSSAAQRRLDTRLRPAYEQLMAAAEKPLGIALLVCDKVITDGKTNEKSLISVFNRIWAKSFPCVHSRLSVFVAMTNGLGQSETEIRCINESEGDKVLFSAKTQLTFKDPNHVLEMSFQFQNVKFAQPGLHSIELLCDSELILQRRFTVSALPDQPPES